MASKQGRAHLTIAEKYEILMLRGGSESRQAISDRFGISRSTLYRIYAESKQIKKQFEANKGFSQVAKRLVDRIDMDIDRIVFHWYLRCKERNVQVTEADIKAKALEINRELSGFASFRAGTSWLLDFKERYSITDVDIRKDVPNETEIASFEAFTVDFNKTLQEDGIALKNVYNVVYTTIMWKAVPESTCILDHAKSTGNLKICEEYVTAIFCANATGCHKLPVVLIGSEPDIDILVNYKTKAFSTLYKSSTNACMNRTIFKEWYKEHFLESVKRRQSENECREKSLLLLDNNMSLHDLDDLNHMDEFVTVKAPPVNVSPRRQPMNCGIITCFRREYRKEFLFAITPLSANITKRDVIEHHRNLRMWDCCRIVHDAWSRIDDTILINSWDSILWPENVRTVEQAEKWDAYIRKAIKLLHKLPGCKQCHEIEVFDWFHIEEKHDIIKKICTEEVLREFKNNTLGPANIGISDEAGPSHA